ncbi:MAG: hypothetical protein SNH88_03710 [Rikenellaceae bacterium]
MVDTVKIEPDIDYSISPRSITTSLTTTPFKPASITYWEYERPKRYYAKVGAGYPLNSIVDLYAGSQHSSVGYMTGFVNHNGRYSTISNNYNERNPSQQIHTSLGFAAGAYTGKHILEGAIQYNNDLWSRYATKDSGDEHPLYNDVGINVRYGDNFIDMSRINFDIGTNVGYFTSRSGYSNTRLGAAISVGGAIGGGEFITSVGYDYIGGSDDYNNNGLNLNAKYQIKTKHGGEVVLGVGFINDQISCNIYDDSDNYLLPELRIRVGAEDGFVPFLEVAGELNRANYSALTDINPYIKSGLYAPKSSVDYRSRIGVAGFAKDQKAHYQLYADYTYTLNALYWLYVEMNNTAGGVDNYYTLSQGKSQRYRFGGDIEYTPSRRLNFTASCAYSIYTEDKAIGLDIAQPKIEAALKFSYKQRKWAISGGGELEGERCWSMVSGEDGKAYSVNKKTYAPTAVNLMVAMEWYTNSRLTLFAEGDNLACAKIYSWGGYREYGVNFTLGAKIQF